MIAHVNFSFPLSYSYENIWNTVSVSRSRRFAKKMGFDEKKYIGLQTEMQRLQDDLALWTDTAPAKSRM